MRHGGVTVGLLPPRFGGLFPRGRLAAAVHVLVRVLGLVQTGTVGLAEMLVGNGGSVAQPRPDSCLALWPWSPFLLSGGTLVLVGVGLDFGQEVCT